MKDIFNIFKSAWEKHEISGAMDLRITMSKKGIKVNLGLGYVSNKPKTFDLREAVLDSCKLSVSWLEQILIDHNNNPEANKVNKHWTIECMKRKQMLEDVINELKNP